MTQPFGLRGRQEHHHLMLEDLKSIQMTTANVITYCPKRAKTRQGGLTKKDRKTPPKQFEIGGPRCFFVLLDLLKSKRQGNLKDKGHSHLKISENPRTAKWYKTI